MLGISTPTNKKSEERVKTRFIRDFLEDGAHFSQITLECWIKEKRHHGGIIFLDLVDSTGTIQAIIERSKIDDQLFELALHTNIESAVRVIGTLIPSQINACSEVQVTGFDIIGSATKQISPSPRGDFDIFDPRFANQVLTNRHLYIRNPKLMAILKFRHLLMGFVHQWFRENQFIEITAPILTPLPLYDDRTAIAVKVHDDEVYLTQCVGFYLEAAVHAFERVYNIGPSFRNEESRSKRHLMEYWHVKAELAFGNIEDIITIVEDVVQYLVKQLEIQSEDIIRTLGTVFCSDGLATPYPRITYRQAINVLDRAGYSVTFGTSLGSDEEAELAKKFSTPFWVVGIPRSIEPFPYVINGQDPLVTQTADLIATRGYGELLGVAEKINDLDMLQERMNEKGKLTREEYGWLLELREFGCVPHIGFGMGVERLIRWLLQVEHVRDAIPFPRSFRRRIYP